MIFKIKISENFLKISENLKFSENFKFFGNFQNFEKISDISENFN